MSKTKYTNDVLDPIVARCTSIRQVLNMLGLQITGGNYAHIQKVIKKLQIDISHFKGQGWNKGVVAGPRRPIEDYLSNENYIKSSNLRNRLIKEGYFEHKCQSCNLTQWQGSPIPLELHHIDRVHTNNNLTNLQILCPNCHTLSHKA